MRNITLVAPVLVSVLFGAPSISHAQFWARLMNPKVEVEMRHPPGLGLEVESVVFGPASGECSEEIIDSMLNSLVNGGLQVLNRSEADLLFAEHEFSQSGWADPASAAAVGEMLGSSVLITLNATRCATEKKPTYRDRTFTRDERRVRVRTYYSTTSAFVNVTIQVVDLATARVLGVIRGNYKPELVNSSDDGRPEFPSEYDVLDMAYAQANQDVSRRLLGWTETRELIFYDDDDCGLKRAHRALKSGLNDDALTISMENLEVCKNDQKIKDNKLARAYYNVGMSHIIVGDNDTGLEYLREATLLDGNDITAEAIASAERSRQLQAEMRKVEEKLAFDLAQRAAEMEQAAQVVEDNTVTNAEIIALVEQELPEMIIMKKIETAQCQFDTSGDGLVALTQASVSEGIIMAMMEANCQD